MMRNSQSRPDGQHILIICGPSGSGKTTLIRRLLMAVPRLPPSLHELRRRLMDRESHWTRSLEARLETARREMSLHHSFDFIVINDVLDNALDALIHIVCAMELRTQRQLQRVRQILGEQE